MKLVIDLNVAGDLIFYRSLSVLLASDSRNFTEAIYQLQLDLFIVLHSSKAYHGMFFSNST